MPGRFRQLVLGSIQGWDVDAVATNTVKSEKRRNGASMICFWGPILFLYTGIFFSSSNSWYGREEIGSLPGVCRWGAEAVLDYLRPIVAAGLSSILLFGVPAHLPKVQYPTIPGPKYLRIRIQIIWIRILRRLERKQIAFSFSYKS